MGQIGLEGLHWKIKKFFLKAQISVKQDFVSGAAHKIHFIGDPETLKFDFNSSVQPFPTYLYHEKLFTWYFWPKKVFF